MEISSSGALRYGGMVLLPLLIVIVFLASRRGEARPHRYIPRARVLQRSDLQFFLPGPSAHGKAVIVFFGNDVGFWKPHEELSERLSREGYDVVGLDLRHYLAHMPTDSTRAHIFADSINVLIGAARREFGQTLPFVLGGHSFGAEIALWLAQHQEPPDLRGVLAMSPRPFGHLTVTPGDFVDREPHGSDAFSTVDAVRKMDPRVRIALVRGSHDALSIYDRAFIAAGGARLRYYPIPLASHSLKRLTLAGPIIEYAVANLLR